MGRRAVAATLVSVVVFTSLLLANSALYSSANSTLGASVLSAEQLRESAYAGILVGVSTYDSLAEVQGFLQSNPLDCSSSQAYLDSMAGGSHETGTEDGVNYETSTSWAYDQGASSEGGSAFLPQFSGYDPGGLNVAVSATLDESYGGGLPSYSSEASETMHLPVPVAAIVSLCLAALSAMQESLSSLPYCNSTAVDGSIGLAESRYPGLASFSVGASASPQQSGCEVSYWVTTTETGLEGPAGQFQWSVRGEGSLLTEEIPGSSPSSV